MKTQSLIVTSILALVLFASMASAFPVNSNNLNLDSDTQTGVITLTSSEDFTVINFNILTKFNVVNTTDISTLSKTHTFDVSLKVSEPSFSNDLSETLNFTVENASSESTYVASTYVASIVKYSNNEICSADEINNYVDVSIDDISTTGFGDDNDYCWYPGDKIEITVDIAFDGKNNDDVKLNLEWALYTSDGKKVIDGDEDSIKLDDGDDDSITFTFTLDVNDLEDGEEDYTFYVWASGDVNSDEDDFDGKELCGSDSQEIEIRQDKHFVIIPEYEIEVQESASCEDSITISGVAWNIGSSDEDDVYVIVYNKVLGLNEKIELGNIDAFNDESFEFTFEIPADIDEKTYAIEFTVYDEDNDVFQNSEDENAKTYTYLVIEGNCGPLANSDNILITATYGEGFENGAIAGKDLVIKSTITSTVEGLNTFVITSTSFNDWADSSSANPSTIILSAGESKEVLITLKVKDNVEGEKSFNIEVLSEGQVVATQPVSVEVQNPSFNWKLWLIILANVILVVAIILVLLRIIRKK